MIDSKPEPTLIPLEKCLAAYQKVVDKFGFTPIIQSGRIQLLDWDLEYVCGAALANMIDATLVRRLNDFFPDNETPLILDCGANIGFTVLNYKRQFPNARIMAFEPDPQFAPVLRRNLQNNHAEDVQVVEAAVWTRNEKIKWFSEGIDGSHIVGDEQEAEISWVQAIDLASYLTKPVDLLKLDIEGAEYEVINHVRKKLRNVKNIVVECHLDQTNIIEFGKMLGILAKAGFKLSVNSYGAWRDLIRQVPVQPYHWEQYILLAGWRAPIPQTSGEESLRPYCGANIELELETARTRVRDTLANLETLEKRVAEYSKLEYQRLRSLIENFVNNKYALESQTIDAPLNSDGGKCWTVSLPGLETGADDEQNPARSELLLFENETLLGPAHSNHDDIRIAGGGRFSHWKGNLYFSTSDGSDPRTNGRKYTLVFVNTGPQNNLDSRERKLTELNTVLKSREAEVANKELTMTARENKIAAREQAITTRENEVTLREQAVITRESEAADRERAIRIFEEEITRREGRYNALPIVRFQNWLSKNFRSGKSEVKD